jgi:FtsH-binding integral membrane protein
LMTVGLVITGFMANLVALNQQFVLRLATNPWLAWGLFLIQIIVVLVLSGAVRRMAPGAAAILFLLYAALTGVTLSTLGLYYTSENISQVFWVAAGTFFLASVAGLISRRDMSSGGGALAMLLLGWLFAWFFSFLFPQSNLNWFLCFVGVALFVGLTVWDSNRLKAIAVETDGRVPPGVVVIGALSLYLDFINLFLLLLRASRR